MATKKTKEEPKQEQEEVSNDGKSNKVGWVILIIVLIAIGAFFIINAMNSSNISGNVVKEPTKSCKDVQVPYDYLEEYQDTVPYTAQECEAKKLAYSIDNFVVNSNTCNKYEDECHKWFMGLCTEKVTFCVDKVISCSLSLKNLDNEERGSWKIEFQFYEAGTSNVIDREDVLSSPYPQSQETVGRLSEIKSTGTTGNANKQITCTYNVVDIPTKQVCRDVIQYKDVTKTRTVTRYRTENQCN